MQNEKPNETAQNKITQNAYIQSSTLYKANRQIDYFVPMRL